MSCRAVIALLSLSLGLLLAAGCAGTPYLEHRDAPPRDPSSARETNEVFVVRRGWHIDVGVDAQALLPPLRQVQAQLPQAKYLLFGFGDRRYLTARSQRFDALVAALRPGAALVLLTGLSDTPQAAFSGQAVRTVVLRPEQMQALQRFIWQTLAHPQGELVPVHAGPYAGSTYLAAVPRYSGLHTCNTWAAEALRAAGLPVHVRAVVFSWQLWAQLPRLQRAGQDRGPARTTAPAA